MYLSSMVTLGMGAMRGQYLPFSFSHLRFIIGHRCKWSCKSEGGNPPCSGKDVSLGQFLKRRSVSFWMVSMEEDIFSRFGKFQIHRCVKEVGSNIPSTGKLDTEYSSSSDTLPGPSSRRLSREENLCKPHSDGGLLIMIVLMLSELRFVRELQLETILAGHFHTFSIWRELRLYGRALSFLLS